MSFLFFFNIIDEFIGRICASATRGCKEGEFMGLMAMVQRQIPTALVLVSRFLLYGVSAGETLQLLSDTDSAVTAP